MTLTLEQLPLIEDEDLGLAQPDLDGYRVDRRLGRRSVMKLLAGAGAFVGFYALGMFKVTRAAGATPNFSLAQSCGSYDPDTWQGFDGTQNGWYDPGGVGQCHDDSCVGTPDIYMGGNYCVTCDELTGPDDPDNKTGFHFIGDRNGVLHGDYQPNICNTAPNSSTDAWKWQISECQGCAPAVYACHDGFKQDNSGFHFTICQGLQQCDGSFVSYASECGPVG